MATADVPIDVDKELEEYVREQRDRISLCFSEARRRLDRKEAELIKLFEEKLNKSRADNKNIATDRNQLKYTLELIQASLSSNSLQMTGDEAIRPIKEKIEKLEEKRTRVQFDWVPQKLYTEISKIGEVATIPAHKKICISSIPGYNTKEEMVIKSVIPPPYKQQKQEIQFLLTKPLQEGEYWYLIHIIWYNQWKSYVGISGKESSADKEIDKPGPIDNTSLLDQDKLRRFQVNERDYKSVPEDAWYKLVSWYGISEGSMGIRRRVVMYGKFVKQCKLEVYPLELKACLYPNETDFKIFTISGCDTIRTMDNKIRKLYDIDSTKQTRIYIKYQISRHELIKDMNLEVQGVELFDGQYVLIEVQNVDGTWHRKRL
ncbi:Ubiquitin carboxyl-terminal hydrolase 4 isoform X5 [Oopsacas minuta]|uniref:Ubiquitin carboxyl-terminal hydrolase 4 isoform X5 n=1 Tax=Oopsacas minuta TaxID=111878 RepID=A0AAV7KFT3_9METZ|nr:Ubiquitin carboxyl-terminal hydrolase 4 isoform X5 [Oopsacas minuta]